MGCAEVAMAEGKEKKKESNYLFANTNSRVGDHESWNVS